MLAALGLALAGGGYVGMRRAKRAEVMEEPQALPPTPYNVQVEPSAFDIGASQQVDVFKPFPANAPGNGLGKDRYLDITKGDSGGFLERYNGVPLVGDRRRDDHPAPPAPTPQGARINGDSARAAMTQLRATTMSQFKNDESPVAQIQVGPGVGYGSSVPAADGFHPNLRVMPTDEISQRNSLRGDMGHAAQFYVGGRTAGDEGVHMQANAPPRYFEKSTVYNTSAKNAGGAGTTFAPSTRQVFQSDCTNRGTEMPALQGATGCARPGSQNGVYGVGTGPAYAAGSQTAPVHPTLAGTYELKRQQDLPGLPYGAGPSAANDAPGAQAPRGHWNTKGNQRDYTGMTYRGSAGVAGPSGGAVVQSVARYNDPLQNTHRQSIPGLPTLNAATPGFNAASQDPFRHGDQPNHQVRSGHRASMPSNNYAGAPGSLIAFPGAGGTQQAMAGGRVADVGKRAIVDAQTLPTAGPKGQEMAAPSQHARVDSFALRSATVHAGNMGGPNRANTFAVQGAAQQNFQHKPLQPDPYTQGLTGTQAAVRGGTYVSPTGTQSAPGRHEHVDERLDVAVTSQVPHAWAKK